MEVIVTRRFVKDAEKELSPKIKLELVSLIEQIQLVSNLNDIPNQKKLRGHKIAYRIKFGDYRIGFLFENNIITLSRIMNRREIYRYFP